VSRAEARGEKPRATGGGSGGSAETRAGSTGAPGRADGGGGGLLLSPGSEAALAPGSPGSNPVTTGGGSEVHPESTSEARIVFGSRRSDIEPSLLPVHQTVVISPPSTVPLEAISRALHRASLSGKRRRAGGPA
jgi:hypothetical protein